MTMSRNDGLKQREFPSSFDENFKQYFKRCFRSTTLFNVLKKIVLKRTGHCLVKAMEEEKIRSYNQHCCLNCKLRIDRNPNYIEMPESASCLLILEIEKSSSIKKRIAKEFQETSANKE